MKPWVWTYPEAKSLVICGDIHGEFVPLVYEMCIRYGMHDTLVIVAGDCGFGFEKPSAYDQVFRRIEKRLAQNNCWIAMVRGNHDDPAYYGDPILRTNGTLRRRCYQRRSADPQTRDGSPSG